MVDKLSNGMDKSKPKIAIILVNYNSVEHTLECIESICRSIYNNLQIVVIDNASNDNCEEKVRQHYLSDKIHLILNSRNYGFAKANNIGINWCLKHKFDYILLLNNDTIIEPDTIEKLVNCYKRHRNVGIVTGKILNYYDRKLIWYAGGDLSNIKGDAKINGFAHCDNGQYDQEKNCSFASGCCMLFDSKTAREHKLPEQYFLYYEDVDFCNQIIREGKDIYYTPEAVIYHKESISTNKKSFFYSYYFSRNRLMYIKKNIGGIYKFISYCYSYLWFAKKILQKELQYSAVKKGIKDYRRGIIGEAKA